MDQKRGKQSKRLDLWEEQMAWDKGKDWNQQIRNEDTFATNTQILKATSRLINQSFQKFRLENKYDSN